MKPIASYQWNLRNLQLTLIVTFHWSTSKQIRWIIAPRVVDATHGDTLLACHWLWSLHSNYIATISASIRWLKSPREKNNTLIHRETSKQCQWNMTTTTLYLKLHIKSNRLENTTGPCRRRGIRTTLLLFLVRLFCVSIFKNIFWCLYLSFVFI